LKRLSTMMWATPWGSAMAMIVGCLKTACDVKLAGMIGDAPCPH